MYEPIEEFPKTPLRPGLYLPIVDPPVKKPRKILPWPDGKRDRNPWLPGVQA